MTKNKKIVLTGGGTAGHVMPNLALVPNLSESGWEIFYIGSQGIEEELIKKNNLPFFKIKSGKLRRYVSWQNFTDVFRIIFGTLQALLHLRRLKPRLIFSKGGFVAVPVTLAGKLLGIPIISHESDLTPGLANRLISLFADKILCAFPTTLKNLPLKKSEWVGTPIRASLFLGHREKAEQFLETKVTKKVILVMGGSLGAQNLNRVLETCLAELIQEYFIIHITGKGKTSGFEHSSYRQFEFVGQELPDLYALADFIISRAGANSIFEFLALKKPMILIPLEQGSRGDQILNAAEFQRQGWAVMVREKDLDSKKFLSTIHNFKTLIPGMSAKQHHFQGTDANDKILEIINSYAERSDT